MATIKTITQAIEYNDGQSTRSFLVFTPIGPSALFFAAASFAETARTLIHAMTLEYWRLVCNANPHPVNAESRPALGRQDRTSFCNG